MTIHQQSFSSSHKYLSHRFVILLFVGGLCVASSTLSAKEQTDVRLLIDVSGSMKKNDANNLRRPAIDLLVKLLPDESKAGIWTFGQSVNMLVPHGQVDEKWQKLASTKTGRIDSSGLYTNIGGVLERAAYDREQQSKKSETEASFIHLILLTDGMVDISKDPAENKKEWRRIVDDILPALKSANFKIHTVALSDNADTVLLNKLSLATDGVAAVANNADDLMKVFLGALDSAAPQEKVPLQNNTFVVDSSVEEFTALVFPKENSDPARLHSPDGSEYVYDSKSEDINWFRTNQYDLVTVNRPIEGEWKLLADLDIDSRVTIVSDLNLVVEPINNNALINKDIYLTLWLEEDSKKIVRKDLLGLINVSYSVQRDNDGATWFDSMATDLLLDPSDSQAGVFSKQLDVFDKPGTYEFKIIIDGKSFSREYSHTVEIREPFVVKVEAQQKDSITHLVTTVVSSHDEIDIKNTKITARITNPSGATSTKLLSVTSFDNWVLDETPKEQGVFKIDVTIDAVKKDGESFTYIPDSIAIKYPDGENVFAEPEVVSKEKIEAALPPSEKPTVSETMDSVAEKPESSLWLYIGLGVGNICVLLLAYFAYRKIMGNKSDSDLEGLEDFLKDADEEEANSNEDVSSEDEIEKTEKTPIETPSMSEVDSSKQNNKNVEKPTEDPVSDTDQLIEKGGTTTDVEFSSNDFADDEDKDDIDKGKEKEFEDVSEVPSREGESGDLVGDDEEPGLDITEQEVSQNPESSEATEEDSEKKEESSGLEADSGAKNSDVDDSDDETKPST